MIFHHCLWLSELVSWPAKVTTSVRSLLPVCLTKLDTQIFLFSATRWEPSGQLIERERAGKRKRKLASIERQQQSSFLKPHQLCKLYLSSSIEFKWLLLLLWSWLLMLLLLLLLSSLIAFPTSSVPLHLTATAVADIIYLFFVVCCLLFALHLFFQLEPWLSIKRVRISAESPQVANVWEFTCLRCLYES